MSTTPDVQVQLIPAEQTRPLRKRVLRPNQEASALVYPGDELPDSIHVGAIVGDAIVGVASMYREDAECGDTGGYRIRGMATDAGLQGQGIGGQVLSYCLEHAQNQGGMYVWCNARTGARRFYEQHGFRVDSELFEIDGIGPHYVMRCDL